MQEVLGRLQHTNDIVAHAEQAVATMEAKASWGVRTERLPAAGAGSTVLRL